MKMHKTLISLPPGHMRVLRRIKKLKDVSIADQVREAVARYVIVNEHKGK